MGGPQGGGRRIKETIILDRVSAAWGDRRRYILIDHMLCSVGCDRVPNVLQAVGLLKLRMHGPCKTEHCMEAQPPGNSPCDIANMYHLGQS